MKHYLLIALTLCLSPFVSALDLSPKEIEGAWKVLEMGGMKGEDNTLWEFRDGRFTQNFDGHRMVSDAYTIKGNKLELGYAAITVMEFGNGLMKAEYGPAVYKLEKVSDKVVITPKPKKEIPENIRKEAEEFAHAMLANVEQADGLDCEKAVANSIQSVDTMLGVGEKNYHSGYMSKEQYDQASVQLNKMKESITLDDCVNSEGKQRLVYTCMSNGRNMFMSCVQQHM